VNVSDILSKAADIIEQRGHCKGWYFGPDGSCCMRGAIILAADPDFPPISEAEAVARKAAGDDLFIHPDAASTFRKLDNFVRRNSISFDAVSWQDAEERSGKQVVSTLRAAAEAARAEQ
jgi:hypothetical protein